MRKRIVALVAAMALSLSFAGVVAAQGPDEAVDDLILAPTTENFVGFCVVNHGALFGPGAIGEAFQSRGAANAGTGDRDSATATFCRSLVTASR